VGRFKTHEERARKKMRKLEEARKKQMERVVFTGAKKSELSAPVKFMKQLKSAIFGDKK
jgi:hypothetical protein